MNVELTRSVEVGYGGRIELAYPELEAGQTVEVQIVTQSKPKRARPVFGRLKGLITIHDNFDDPIPGLVR